MSLRRSARDHSIPSFFDNDLHKQELLLNDGLEESFGKEEEMSVKYQKQRAKNREAVRNCRKRKREQAEVLRSKIAELRKENEMLRVALRTGQKPDILMSSSIDERSVTEETLLDKIKAHVSVPENEKNSASLPGIMETFLAKFQDHGREKQNTISFLVSGMRQLISPSSITLFFLHLMAQESNEFDSFDAKLKEKNIDPDMILFPGHTFPKRSVKNSKVITKLIKYLGLTEIQEDALKKRRLFAQRLQIEVEYAQKQIDSVYKRLVKSKPTADAMSSLNSVLSPWQLAKYVVWVQTNPACKDMLNSLWESLMEKYSKVFSQETNSSSEYKEMLIKYQVSAARLTSPLFTASMSLKQCEKIGKLVFHPDVFLTDVNNGCEFRGLNGMQKYIAMIGHAYSQKKVELRKGQYIYVPSFRSREVKLEVSSGKEEVEINGEYELSGWYKGKLGSKDNRTFVNFRAYTDFYFGDVQRPELITEMTVSWDTMGLLKQLGLEKEIPKNAQGLPKSQADAMRLMGFVPEETKQQQRSATSSETDPSSSSRAAESNVSLQTTFSELRRNQGPLTEEDSRRIHEKLAQAFARLFVESSDNIGPSLQDICLESAMFCDVYTGNEYDGISEALAYIKRLKRAFPKITMMSGNLVNTSPLAPITGPGSVEVPRFRVEFKASYEALYKGKLLLDSQEKACNFDTVFFVECDPLLVKIVRVTIMFAAQDLIYQLGILR